MTTDRTRTERQADDGTAGATGGVDRRKFIAAGASLGTAAGIAALGLDPEAAMAAGGATMPRIVGAPAIEPLVLDGPMAKWKQPLSLDFVQGANARYSFANWQSGSDDSVYYNLNLPAFFKSKAVIPPGGISVLERAIRPDLLDVAFKAHDGGVAPPLKTYLVGPRQVQAMMMAHKGKVVFETYPGMNPTNIHATMSTAKTTASLLAAMLWEEGKLDLDKPVPTYVPELKGTAWDAVTMTHAMNMASGLDIEETFENLVNPDSWIAKFFTAAFEGKGDWRQLNKEAKPIPGERPGQHFRYSSAITMVLVLAVENISGLPWDEYFNQRVWSKIGARNPCLICLTPDGTPLGAGLLNVTPEDWLRYALLYTPSWRAVAERQVISDRLLKRIQTLGDPKAYAGTTEEGYGTRWFGVRPDYNTAQWDHAFHDGALFKHGNMGQGIYVDPARDFAGVYFGLAPNQEDLSGIDHAPGHLRAAAKILAGG
ncbi:serine hydrolase domain-containing protein [Albimonas pacifica]|uniref:CubicO group peptidase, beta-lactamase class C family n=1 Tax=Albimonas pacifica TaxID=1114924 RepID=A0A1I3BQY3_9RHOB|nr:serine hydrolase domain-containing protein [Albimonas pacifica]SFH64496.1 CubicO group peptidase, beta-lactamase class C family [Albimonas pacifica]